MAKRYNRGLSQSFVNGPFDTIEEASNHANKELGIIE